MKSDDRIYKKLLEHDKRWEQNDKRWEQNDKRWEENNKQWEQNDKRWEENNKQWEQNDKCTDRLIKKLLDHDEKFAQTATSKEVQALRNDMARGFDQIMLILKRLDEERVFTATWIERVEKEVKRLAQESMRLAQESVRLAQESSQHAKEIKQVKVRLKIA
ncbi:MAG: hypothetical protein HY981_02620 [Candidatus Magasanikbacteria bacterium]|nr:hypothetical protein [Candidatus Magasanikbacteria bacterium]